MFALRLWNSDTQFAFYFVLTSYKSDTECSCWSCLDEMKFRHQVFFLVLSNDCNRPSDTNKEAPQTTSNTIIQQINRLSDRCEIRCRQNFNTKSLDPDHPSEWVFVIAETARLLIGPIHPIPIIWLVMPSIKYSQLPTYVLWDSSCAKACVT